MSDLCEMSCTVSVKLVVERTVPDMDVHWACNDEIWSSSGYSIFASKNRGVTFSKMITLPVPMTRGLLARFRLTCRAFRLGVRALRILKSGTILVVANRKLYRIADNNIESTHCFRHGFGPLRQGWCEDDNGHCYLTEYSLNNARTVASQILLSCNDGESWEVIKSLIGIRHIHCMQYDPFAHGLWMGTGDKNSESSISYSQDFGKTWIVFGSGDQTFRAVSLLFTNEYIYWGSDAPSRQNYIFRRHRKSDSVEKLAAVNGTVLYSTMLGNGIMLFGTTDEGNSEGKNPTSDKKAHIWASYDGTHWEDIINWEKDSWPYILGFGSVLFAGGHPGSGLFYTTKAVKGMDGVLSCASVMNID